MLLEAFHSDQLLPPGPETRLLSLSLRSNFACRNPLLPWSVLTPSFPLQCSQSDFRPLSCHLTPLPLSGLPPGSVTQRCCWAASGAPAFLPLASSPWSTEATPGALLARARETAWKFYISSASLTHSRSGFESPIWCLGGENIRTKEMCIKLSIFMYLKKKKNRTGGRWQSCRNSQTLGDVWATPLTWKGSRSSHGVLVWAHCQDKMQSSGSMSIRQSLFDLTHDEIHPSIPLILHPSLPF